MILVTGANGQLGQSLREYLADDEQTIFADRVMLDLGDCDAIKDFAAEYEIECVINCAAYTAVDAAESDQDAAFFANKTIPENLAKTIRRIVHISTDYVFDGVKWKTYYEADKPNPLNVYGKSKLAGEIAVAKNAESAAIIRTQWLYSPYGKNFLKTMLRLGAEKSEIGVVDDQFGSPTSAMDLAAAAAFVAREMRRNRCEIYHFANHGCASWASFAAEIMANAKLGCKVRRITTAEFPQAALRPEFSVLNSTKIFSDFGVNVPDWRDSLKKTMEKMK